MRDQYAGDVSDFLKFAFLRALSCKNGSLAVWWYYIAGDDGRSDGRHKEWTENKAYASIDEELFNILAPFAKRDVRTVQGLEELNILPAGTKYFPSRENYEQQEVTHASGRDSWFQQKWIATRTCSLFFLDPDNGVHLTERKSSRKHARLREVRHLLEAGKNLCYITFPHRNSKHEDQLQSKHSVLHALAPDKCVLTLRTTVHIQRKCGTGMFPRTRWFTLVTNDPEQVCALQRFKEVISKQPGMNAKLYPE